MLNLLHYQLFSQNSWGKWHAPIEGKGPHREELLITWLSVSRKPPN